MEDKGHGEIKGRRSTTLAQGIFNLSKSAVGAGALALPSDVRQLGLVGGVGVLLFASFMTTVTLHFLARVAANLDVGDYFTLGNMAFGVAGEVMAMVSLILFLIGGLIFYISLAQMFITDFLQFVIPSLANYTSSLPLIFTVAIALLIMPLAVQRDMSVLAKGAMIGMICMGYILALTVVDYFYALGTGSVATDVDMFVSLEVGQFFRTFSSMLFAFVNHFTMLSVVPVMIDPSPKRRMTLTLGSGGVVIGFYLLVAVCGYLHFGNAVPKFILSACTSDSAGAQWAYKIGSLLMGLVLILSYPLLLDPTRGTIEGAMIRFAGSPARSPVRSLIITASIVGISTFTALTFKDQVSTILRIFVAFAGSLLLFIFPAGFFLRFQDKYRVSAVERILAYVCIAFGFVLMILGSYHNIADLIATKAQ
jgi:amino acid permease